MTRTASMLLLAVAGWCTSALAAPQFGPQSLLGMPFVGDAQVSQDGRRIAYVVYRAEPGKDDYQGDIWLIDGDAAPRVLIGGPSDDARPRWSPDGQRLAFVSNRAEKRQVFVLDLDGGEAWPLTKAPEGVGSYAWSPDGQRIAYLARPARKEAAPAAPAGAAGKARITERLFYRFDGAPGFLPEQRSRIWITDVSADADAPVALQWSGETDPSEPAWTPDGTALYFSALPSFEPPTAPSDTEIYRIEARAGAAATVLTTRRGPDDGPIAVAPDGRVAWTGFDESQPVQSSNTRRLYAAPVRGATLASPTVVTARLDRNVGETVMSDAPMPRNGAGARVAFDRSSGQLYFLAADRGRAWLYRAASSGGEPRVLSGELDGDLREFSRSPGGRIVGVFGSPTQPYEVWSLDREGAKWRQLTHHGRDAFPDAQFSAYEEIEATSFDGKRIQGWLLKPPGFDPAQRYPLILYIHGGPHAMYGVSFFHEFQVLANAGFLVLITNPRGSTGYGEAFANIVQFRYPGDDYHDLMAALDLVAKRPYVDTQRLGIGGGSGGGVLTSWSIAQTDRFSAALVERPVVNFASHAMVADLNGVFAQRWFHDYPWRSPQEYFDRSPVNFVEKVKTPVLVIQSEQDFRTPIDQGLAYYNALRILGKPAKLVLFPTSSHGLSRDGPPSQRVERLEIIVDWFTTRLRPKPAAPRSAGG